jgi:hypothetical protein
MPIGFNYSDPLDATVEFPGAPLSEVLTQFAESIAEGQARLDLSSAQVVQELAETKVSIIPYIRQIIEDDGTVRFEQAEPTEVSLLDIGLVPTFLAFSEAKIALTMDLKIVEDITETSTTKGQRSLFAATRSIQTERRLNREVSGHTKVSITMIPVPSPIGVAPVRYVED